MIYLVKKFKKISVVIDEGLIPKLSLWERVEAEKI